MSPAPGRPPIKGGPCHNNFIIFSGCLTFAKIERKYIYT